jgi:hypothetical protein
VSWTSCRSNAQAGRTTKASDASGISFDCGGCGEKMAGLIFRDIERLVATA